MKFVLIILAVMLTGCATGVRQVVSNNTVYILDVSQNGKQVCMGLQPGQLVTLPWNYGQEVSVSVAARTPSGVYVGSNTYSMWTTYSQTWQVNSIIPPARVVGSNTYGAGTSSFYNR